LPLSTPALLWSTPRRPNLSTVMPHRRLQAVGVRHVSADRDRLDSLVEEDGFGLSIPLEYSANPGFLQICGAVHTSRRFY
jgi:hypothetical protein